MKNSRSTTLPEGTAYKILERVLSDVDQEYGESTPPMRWLDARAAKYIAYYEQESGKGHGSNHNQHTG